MIDSIRTDLFELRPLREDDRAEFVRMHEISVDHFGPWMPVSESSGNAQKLFDDERANIQAGVVNKTEVRMVAALPDGRVAGVFALSQIFRRSFLNAYAGWRVSVDQIDRGIGTAGVAALLDLAFADEPVGLGLHRVQANIVPGNHASIRIAGKTGFRLEGVAKEYLQINGVWTDHLMYAKLAKEHIPRYL